MNIFANKVTKGQFFIVLKKSKSYFKILSIKDNSWEKVVNFTKIKKGGVEINQILKKL